ncbi:hydroxyacid dehydrogenase [Aestuariimicrobium soli]|uniref:hydroxyacid dehydrogenase n=1 Tax=Aestuariimicrobium soli TaxID=2035834 RepID=UPI003EBB2092
MSAPVVLLAVHEHLREPFFGRGELERLQAVADVRLAADPGTLSAAELAEAIVLVTGWGTGRLTPELLDSAPRLTTLVHSAGSLRAVLDPDCYRRDGFIASCQSDTNALPVVDFTLAVVILALKNAFVLREKFREHRTDTSDARSWGADGVPFRRVAIVGASRIGRGVLAKLRPLEVELGLYDPYVTADEAAELGATKFDDLVELARWSEVFSVHAPWLPSTEGLVSAEVLAALPDGSHFINTSRGAVVDEPALVAELQTGRFDAVLDVTWPEPPEADSPLWELPNVFLTPHIAGSQGTEFGLLGRGAIDEAIRVVTGQPLVHPVDAAGYERQA